MSQFLKLKEEVTKWPQGYVQRRAKHITCSLTPDHEAVKCLVAFGENALKYAAEVLATIEWVYPTLETTGVLPGALHAEMAPDTGVDADHDTFKRGATANPLWRPPRGHLYPQPCNMGMDSCPPAVLAGPHVQTIVQGVLPAGQ